MLLYSLKKKKIVYLTVKTVILKNKLKISRKQN